MSDEIRTLTARLAEEPGSLAFLELGEALRRRGQFEAAAKIARGGLARYPGLADAHDLVARILSDQGDYAGAFDAWADALRLDPMRVSALKGIGFLYFRAGDVSAAIDHLQRAAELDPDDESIAQAIGRVRRESRLPGGPAANLEPSLGHASPMPPVGEPDSPFAGMDEGEQGLLLVDGNGLLLGGRLETPESADTGERVAAQLAGVSREATRAVRMLGLGAWQSIAVETGDAHLVLVPPTRETVLLAARESTLPLARLTFLAERAARVARGWLERVR